MTIKGIPVVKRFHLKIEIPPYRSVLKKKNIRKIKFCFYTEIKRHIMAPCCVFYKFTLTAY